MKNNKVKCISIDEQIDDLKDKLGFDAYDELEADLSKNISDAIDEQILTELTGMDKEAREKHFKRKEKIDILLDDKEEE